MAWEDRVHDIPGLVATADLSANQFYFVKLDPSNADQVIICAAHNDRPVGVLQNKPKAGEAAQVRRLGVSKVIASATLAVGNEIGTDASGKCIAKNPTATGADYGDYVIGEVIEGANASELATVYIGSPFYRI